MKRLLREIYIKKTNYILNNRSEPDYMIISESNREQFYDEVFDVIIKKIKYVRTQNIEYFEGIRIIWTNSIELEEIIFVCGTPKTIKVGIENEKA